MQTSILKMEVRHKQKHVATLVRYSNEDTLVIGHAKKAGLRLFNSEVSSMHAAIHYTDNSWWIRDLGSSGGTWVNKKAVVEHELQPGQQIRIGQHDIFITTFEKEVDLFPKDKESPGKGAVYHQVVVKTKEKLYRTHLLNHSDSFVWKSKEYPAPKDGQLASTEVDGYLILQKLVRLEKELIPSKEATDGLTREAMVATSSVGLLFAIFLIFSIFSLSKPEMNIKLPEAKTAKFIPLKMEKSNFVPSGMDASPGPAAKDQGQGSAAKAIAANFSAVIGRVTQRLSKASINLQKSGSASTTVTNSASAMAMAGASKDGVAGLAQKIGSGGGSSSGVQVMGGGGVAGIGQLQQGSLGTGNVAAQEDESEVMGGLDKEVIAKIIRSYLGQIRYCYERQLSATPDLYGKLLVHFSIGQTGTVNTQSILSSSLQNKNVEGCVLKQVAAWKFPQPKGGTIVKVSYPFLFTSTK